MNHRLFVIAVALLLLAGLGRAAAQAPGNAPASTPGTTILERTSGRYRIVATANPFPLEVGSADIYVTVTDAASGAPAPVSAINVITLASELGRDQLYLAPPVDEKQGTAIYKTDRLYFAVGGLWQVRVQLIADGGVEELATTVEVAPVLDRIKKAAVVAVPATLAGLLAVALGWRWWRRRQAAAQGVPGDRQPREAE